MFCLESETISHLIFLSLPVLLLAHKPEKIVFLKHKCGSDVTSDSPGSVTEAGYMGGGLTFLLVGGTRAVGRQFPGAGFFPPLSAPPDPSMHFWTHDPGSLG